MIKIEFESDDIRVILRDMRAMVMGAEQTVPREPHVEKTGPDPDYPGTDDGSGEETSEHDTTEKCEDTNTENAPRRFGRAPTGKSRRTKEEMAQDDEIAKMAEVLGVDIPTDRAADDIHARCTELLEKQKAELLDMKTVEDSEPNISKEPENRRDPLDNEAPEATREDMLSAMEAYVEKHGIDKAREDLPNVMGYAKQSQVPDDPEIFGAVVAKIKAALNG